MDYFNNEFFLIALTFSVYFFGKLLRKWTGWVLMNPILVTICILIAFLKLTGVSYETYQEGGHLIEFWLRPAVVALGVPLYLQLSKIKQQFWQILFSEFAGCVVGLVSVVLIARGMGASREVILSLAPKSVTTPIAMEVTESVGGIPALTAAHGGSGGVRGTAVCRVWLQDYGLCPCAQQGCPGTFHGHGSPCAGHRHVDGCEPCAWCLCQSRTDFERHFHGAYDANHH